MNKEQFLQLEDNRKIRYINDLLGEGYTVKEVRGMIGIGEKLFQKIIREANCKYHKSLKLYLIDDIHKERTKRNGFDYPFFNNRSNTKVILEDENYNSMPYEEEQPIVPKESNTLVIPNEFQQQWDEMISFKNNMVAMQDDLKEVVKAYKDGYYNGSTEVIEVVEDKGIKIRDFRNDIKATTIKIHEESLYSWNKFCEANKQYSKQDLISMALEEYINKYSKEF